MKQKGRKLLPVLLMIWPYVLPFFNFLENEQLMSLVAGLYSVLSVAVCIYETTASCSVFVNHNSSYVETYKRIKS